MAVTATELERIGRPDLVKETTQKKDAAQGIEDRFLKLLITQMRNQDPLNPLDNAQVTSQMAQISTVTGVEKLNTSMAALSEVITSAQTTQATSLVGHSVLAPGGRLERGTFGAGGATGGYDLEKAALLVQIDILDKDGKSVRALQYQDQPAGISTFNWDGMDSAELKAADNRGPYTFRVSAINNGEAVVAKRLAQTLVQSVTLGGSELVLNTKSLGTLTTSDIKQVF